MFVVFEGIDGSGKTTVSNQVAERLKSAGLKIKHLRAEGKFVSTVSEAIRDLGRDARNIDLTPQAEFLLYVARDVQLIEEALRPALKKSDVVLADRFLFTAEILGRTGRHLPASFVEPVLKAAAGGLEPDLVVLVDVDPVLARARRKAYKLAAADRRPPSRKGLSGVGLQHRIRRGYLELAAANPERWFVVKNEDSLEETVAKVTGLIATAQAEGVAVALQRFRSPSSAESRPTFAPRTPAEALDAFLAWLERRAQSEPRVAAYLLGGLFGPRVDDIRRRLAERVPEAVLAASSGRLDEVTWELRDKLRAQFPGAVLRTINGVPNTEPRAAALRASLEAEMPLEVLLTMSRHDDETAWAARDRLYDRFPEAVVGTLGGLNTERAWAMRERWLAQQEHQISSNYELARIAVKSIGGVGGERAWRIREKAKSAAPVSALGSISKLTDEQSWRWRSEYVKLAPKVVMGTLRHSSDPRSWELRRTVALDCKEAIDSIQDLDQEEAWQLREACLDTWPSTIVKSLGPLADGERGQQMVARQLLTHPTNVSLLRHAAAIALGVHRILDDEE